MKLIQIFPEVRQRVKIFDFRSSSEASRVVSKALHSANEAILDLAIFRQKLLTSSISPHVSLRFFYILQKLFEKIPSFYHCAASSSWNSLMCIVNKCSISLLPFSSFFRFTLTPAIRPYGWYSFFSARWESNLFCPFLFPPCDYEPFPQGNSSKCLQIECHSRHTDL